jgi:mannose-6-phosphate isomerase
MMKLLAEKRPWGSYQVLEDQENFKVKRIEVLPGQRLSYQKHFKRSEHWFVVAGCAHVTLEGKEIILQPGQSVDIPFENAHRVANKSEKELLVFIEIQRGSYFGEDDIVRFSDDYGRE